MRYIVDLYDAFDGWIYVGMEPPKEHTFDNLENAIKLRNALNDKLDKANIFMIEHWGVIDTEINQEVECCLTELL